MFCALLIAAVAGLYRKVHLHLPSKVDIIPAKLLWPGNLHYINISLLYCWTALRARCLPTSVRPSVVHPFSVPWPYLKN